MAALGNGGGSLLVRDDCAVAGHLKFAVTLCATLERFQKDTAIQTLVLLVGGDGVGFDIPNLRLA
jgi:hypothetical protein